MNPPAHTRLDSRALQTYSGFSEVRVLLHRLENLRAGGTPLHSVAVLSENIGEGKSFVCSVLAAGLGSPERRVLVVDAAPDFGREEKVIEAIAEPIEYVDVIRLHDAGEAEASVPGAKEGKLRELLDRVRSQYAWILVDTAALVRRNRHNFDPMIVASLCDAAVVVAGDAPHAGAAQFKRQADELGVRIAGVIRNERPVAESPGKGDAR